MTTTYERVVPLTHYAWITTHQSSIQQAKNTPYEQKFKELLISQLYWLVHLGYLMI